MSEFGFVAARMPSGTAITIETMRPSSVNSADAGKHVANEALVSGNVYKADAQHFAVGRGQIHVSKP